MKYRFTFNDITGGTSTPLAHDADGWKSYGVTFGRETGISNVVKSYTSQWIFVKEDRDYLLNKLLTYGPNRRITLTIESSTLGVSWIHEYTGTIDLTQASWDAHTFKAPITEGGFFKALENKWSETLLVDADKPMLYDGIYATETVDVYRKINEGTSNYGSIPGLAIYANTDFYLSSILHVRNAPEIFSDVNADSIAWSGGTDTVGTENCFVSTFGDCYYHGAISIVIKRLRYQWPQSSGVLQKQGMRLYAEVINYDYPEDDTARHFPWELVKERHTVSIDLNEYSPTYDGSNPNYGAWDNVELSIPIPTTHSNGNTNIAVVFRFRCLTSTLVGSLSLGCYGIKIDGQFKVSARRNTAKNIMTAKAEDVFSGIVSQIAGTRYNVIADTSATSSPFTECLLASGQGLRRFGVDENGVRVYPATYRIGTSLSDFLSWCYACFGYVFTVDYDRNTDTYTASLKPYSDVYSSSQITELEHVNNVELSVNRSMLYSSIRVGCETNDGALGGLEEYNSILVFGTTNREVEENVLEIVTPYKTSVFSIDQYIYDNYGKLDPDGVANDTDSDISVFHCVLPVGVWTHATLDRSIAVTSGVSTYNLSCAYNVALSPKRMMLAHSLEINSYLAFEMGNDVEFSSCEYNSEMVAGGVTESAPYTISSTRLFVPVTAVVNSPALSSLISAIESERTGYFAFYYDGRSYEGYIADGSDSVTVMPMRNEASQFTLLLRGI